MRLLVFLPSTAIGGAERVVLNIVNHARTFGIEPLLVLGLEGPLSDSIAPHVERIVLNVARSRNAVHPLAKLIQQHKPDLLLGSKPNASIALTAAWKLAGKRGALILRETNHRTGQGMPRYTPFALCLSWAYHQATALIASTHSMKCDLQKRYNLEPQKIKVLNNPFDLEYITHVQPRVLPENAHSAANTFKLLAVGRLIKQKGFDLLLEALTELRDYPIHLSLVGEGPERSSLQMLSRSLQLEPHVSFVGPDPHPYKWMHWADAYVLSSRWEGFPNALVESMACGLAVVATRCPSGPEEIITPGQDGLLCPANDAHALAEALRELITQPSLAQRLGEAAAASAQRFAIKPFMGEFKHFAETLLNSQPTNGAMRNEALAATPPA